MCALFIAVLASYAIARPDFPFERAVLTTITATSAFPVVSLVLFFQRRNVDGLRAVRSRDRADPTKRSFDDPQHRVPGHGRGVVAQRRRLPDLHPQLRRRER
ncbi:hypothetical protein GCM10026982_22750 [Nocardiopsis aegyptia]